MKQLKLKILYEDIRQNNYMSPSFCPITKALHRAGYKNMHDAGTRMYGNIDGEKVSIAGDISTDIGNQDYIKMVKKLAGMYRGIGSSSFSELPDMSITGIVTTEPKDFTITINY